MQNQENMKQVPYIFFFVLVFFFFFWWGVVLKDLVSLPYINVLKTQYDNTKSFIQMILF